MAQVVRAVKMRLGAAKTLLASVEGDPKKKQLSAIQAAAVVAAVKDKAISAADLADLAEIAMGVPWASADDSSTVLCAFVRGKLPDAKRRRSSQNFVALGCYGTAELWELMRSSASAATKLDRILKLALDLGCRCPSEPTVKWWASFWMMLTETEESLNAMTPVDKAVRLKHVKATFHARCKKVVDPVSWIEELPSSPAELHKAHPGVYAGAFPGDTAAIVAPINWSEVSALDMTYGCRGGMTKLVQPAPVKVQISGHACASPAEEMAASVFSKMEKMMQMQLQMMQFMAGTCAPAGQPRALAALADLTVRRPQPQLALPMLAAPADVAAASSHELAVMRQTSYMSEPMSPHSLPESPPAKAPSAADRSASDDVGDLLEMLESRAKPAKPRGAKGSSKGKPSLEPVDSSSSSNPALEGSSSSSKVTTPTSSGASKGSKRKKGGAIAAVAKAAKSVDAPPKPADKLGCSKCRWSSKGCGQCRSASYRPFSKLTKK
jgi:hypothetical protein